MVKEQRIASSESYPNSILFFRCEEVNANTEYLVHAHNWGQIICVKSGVFVLSIDGQRFVAPSGFALWIPPEVEHASHNDKPTWFRSININAHFCQGMPKLPCLLGLSMITYAIIESFFKRNIMVPSTEQDQRLCQVLIDQLQAEPLQHNYLPSSADKYLSPILSALEENPTDNTTLAQWAKKVYTTERTLARRCQKELGMSFREWRQRLRFVHSVFLLEQGKTVQNIAFDLGYSSTSAFITMFRQIAGVTPEYYRHQSSDNSF
ncbi:AraC family transcriptional regulator [Neisseria sp. Ec49-e6-T10]|uniref:AraC family transcriptional regulator n=1 Tax=Neisseria sp. Ec49-e6-T10 TaxID=3140744 RepID=UPI003EBBE2BE